MARQTNKEMNKKNTVNMKGTKNFDGKKRVQRSRVKVKPTDAAKTITPVILPTNEEMIKAGKFGYIEYKMPINMAQAYLDDRKGAEVKVDPQKYLCNLVNEQYGLLGYCVKVIVA